MTDMAKQQPRHKLGNALKRPDMQFDALGTVHRTRQTKLEPR